MAIHSFRFPSGIWPHYQYCQGAVCHSGVWSHCCPWQGQLFAGFIALEYVYSMPEHQPLCVPTTQHHMQCLPYPPQVIVVDPDTPTSSIQGTTINGPTLVISPNAVRVLVMIRILSVATLDVFGYLFAANCMLGHLTLDDKSSHWHWSRVWICFGNSQDR